MAGALLVQVLAAHGPRSAPDHVVVDACAIANYIDDQLIGPRAWDELVEAMDRAGRLSKSVWVVAPDPIYESTTERATMAQDLRARGLLVVEAREPCLALVEGIPHVPKLCLVTVDIENLPYRIWPLDRAVEAVVDVRSGKLWNYVDAFTEGVEPALEPVVQMATGVPGVLKPLTKDAARRRNAVLSCLAGYAHMKRPAEPLPPWLKEALDAGLQDRLTTLFKILSAGPPDDGARAELRDHLTSSPATSPANDGTVYIVAPTRREGSGATLDWVTVDAEGRHRTAFGSDVKGLLRDVMGSHPGRWFAPQGLDLLGWMVDQDLPLPEALVDPGLSAFILKPDQPVDLGEMRALAQLPTSVINWVSDVDRRTHPPADNDVRACLLEALPALDVELASRVGAAGLSRLLEDDVAKTLPVLAAIERRGPTVDVPDCFPDWDDVLDSMLGDVTKYERSFAPEFLRRHADPYTTKMAEVLTVIGRKGAADGKSVPVPNGSTEKQVFKRWASGGLPAAVDLQRARSFAMPKGSLWWAQELAATNGGTLRGRLVPQRTGRWGYSSHPLQNLPKHSPEGLVLRRALHAPDGYVLVSADYKAFELRLLAALSGDKALLAAARAPDPHMDVALQLGLGSSQQAREIAKAAMYPIIYCQTQDGFVRAATSMAPHDAEALFRKVAATFKDALAYREKVLRRWRKLGVRTLGSWIRMPKRKSEAFATLVQGLGADILRAVLRQLARSLDPKEAYVQMQAHDEIIVATRPGYETTATSLLEQAMTTAGGISLPNGVSLTVNTKRGTTWADLI